MFEHFYQKISSLLPRGLNEFVARRLVQGGFADVSGREFLGFAVFFAFCVGIAVFFLSHFYLAGILVYAAGLSGFAVTLVLFYMWLVMAADSRAQKIELILPDVLEIISSNIRAGMTLENAVWSAARPEFGPLKDEIKTMSADVFGGKPIGDAFLNMTKRVNSDVLERSVRLIVEGIRLGGEMAKLLKAVSDDIRSNQALKKEIATSTMMYTIFIIFAAVLAAPLLFAVSVYYAEMNENMISKRAQDTSAQIPQEAISRAGLTGSPMLGMMQGGKTGMSISPQEVNDFAIECIFVTTLSAALILGLIRYGKWMRGVKYAPIFVVGGLSIFLVVHTVLLSVFKTLLH